MTSAFDEEGNLDDEAEEADDRDLGDDNFDDDGFEDSAGSTLEGGFYLFQ